MAEVDIVFTCPKCGCHKIEEIMMDLCVASDISISEHPDGTIDFAYGDQSNEGGGHVDRYQCGECGRTIVDHNSPHSDDGLDVAALAKAINAINNPPKQGEQVSFDELVTRISDQYSTLSGEELAQEWNRLFPEQVVYEGDSMFWVMT